MKKNVQAIIAFLLFCLACNRVIANDNVRDTSVVPPFVASSSYNDSIYTSILSAAIGISQPFLLQQGYITMPGVTVVDTALIYNGVKYLTSDLYYTPRDTSRTGYYIASSDYPYFGIDNFSKIWPLLCPNILLDTLTKTFHCSTDCIGYGARVIASVGGTTSTTNAFMKLANAMLKGQISHWGVRGEVPNSYDMTSSFEILQTTPVNGWEYISGNGLFSAMNTYNHILTPKLKTYTGVRKGGFGLSKIGDVLCYGDGPLSASNGHTMIMATDPIKLDAAGMKTFFPKVSSSKRTAFLGSNNIYQVNVYDDCNHLHYNDSRATSKITGIGYGSILIVTDTLDDAPIGYFFTPSTSSLTYTPLDTTKTYAIAVARYTDPSQLPVTIESLSADVVNKLVQLKWQTVLELNIGKYMVQHSTDAKNFVDVGTVNAIGSRANGYQFIDNNPADGTNYYRLESVDKDGSSSYSKVVSVQFTVNSNQLTVFPNPSKDFVTIKGNHITLVQVIDNIGRVIKTVSLKDATNPVLSVGGLRAGVYHLRIQIMGGEVSSTSFVKE